LNPLLLLRNCSNILSFTNRIFVFSRHWRGRTSLDFRLLSLTLHLLFAYFALHFTDLPFSKPVVASPRSARNSPPRPSSPLPSQCTGSLDTFSAPGHVPCLTERFASLSLFFGTSFLLTAHGTLLPIKGLYLFTCFRDFFPLSGRSPRHFTRGILPRFISLTRAPPLPFRSLVPPVHYFPGPRLSLFGRLSLPSPRLSSVQQQAYLVNPLPPVRAPCSDPFLPIRSVLPPLFSIVILTRGPEPNFCHTLTPRYYCPNF